MWLFNSKDKYEGYNIYSLKKYVDKKRIALNIIIVIIIIITLILTIYYLIDTKLRLENQIKFENQLIEEQLKLQEEIKRQAKIPKLTEIGKANVKSIYKSEYKRVFLTFDDGPSNNTDLILDILNQYNIKATFFVLGSQVQVMPETTRRIYNEGHFIANHGYSHKYSEIYGSKESVLEEYNKCNEIISQILGVPEYNSHLFRFPGGSVGGYYWKIKKEAISLLEQNNIVYVDWNALTGDSEVVNPTEEYLNNNLQKTTQGKKSIVVLMHDTQAKKVTVDFLPKAIEYFKNQGYEFENFYDIIK